jgi:hypothetical protein
MMQASGKEHVMRLVLILAALPLLGAAPPAEPQPQPAAPMPLLNPQQESDRCPETPMSIARKQGERLRADPLNRLPPAQTFMAVDRRIEGCPAPMLLSEVRGR